MARNLIKGILLQICSNMTREEELRESVLRFFTDDVNSARLHGILDRESGISLRSLEWFATKFAKKENVYYKTKSGREFLVHVNYKSSLAGYSKRLFDPFCRSARDIYTIGGKSVKTTVAQLNFIRWCISNDVIDYMYDHIDTIMPQYRKGNIETSSIGASKCPIGNTLE